VNDTSSHPVAPIWDNLFGEDARGPYRPRPQPGGTGLEAGATCVTLLMRQ
jgi:hypothetical protein